MTIAPLDSSQSYYYKVRAIFGPAESLYAVNAYSDPSLPSAALSPLAADALTAPADVYAVPTGQDTTEIIWSRNSDGRTAGYRVYRGLTPDFAVDATSLIFTYTDPNHFFYGDGGLAEKTTYYYKIVAVDSSSPPAQSPPSEVASATTYDETYPLIEDLNFSLSDDRRTVTLSTAVKPITPVDNNTYQFHWELSSFRHLGSSEGDRQYAGVHFGTSTDTANTSSVTAKLSEAGFYTFAVSATNGFGHVVQKATVEIEVDQVANALAISPVDAFVTEGHPYTFQATVNDQFLHPMESASTISWSQVGGASGSTITAGGMDNPNTGIFSSSTTGTAAITAVTGDLAAIATLHIVAKPIGTITFPAGSGTETPSITGVVDVMGTASAGSDPIVYSLIARPSDGAADVIIKESNATVLTNGVLGTLDPTLLRDGAYTLVLTVTNRAGDSVVIKRVISVAGELKLGNFKISQTDMVVPIFGMPISIVRSYDSLNRGKATDFGSGWTLGLSSDIQEGAVDRWEYPVVQSSDMISVRHGVSDITNETDAGRRSRDVWLTLPDGRRIKFTFGILSENSVNTALFEPAPGVRATLTIEGDNHIHHTDNGAAYWGDQLGNQLGQLGQDITGEYDIPGYILTLPDGTRYHYTKTESPDTAGVDFEHQRTIQLGEGAGEVAVVQNLYSGAPQLTKIDDPLGNTLTITPDGITSSTGANVSFARDSQGRIINISGPAHDTVRYSYKDPVTGGDEGDLRTVTHERTDPNGTAPNSTTTFFYQHIGSGPSTHLFQKMTSDSGKTPVINAYDDKGRLQSTTDAFNHTITYGYDSTPTDHPAYRQQVVVDRNQGTTVSEYDANGDVRVVKTPNGVETDYTYDVSHQLTGEIDNASASPYNQVTKTYAYDPATGAPTTETTTAYVPSGISWVLQTTTSHQTYGNISVPAVASIPSADATRSISVLLSTDSPTRSHTVNEYYQTTVSPEPQNPVGFDGNLSATLVYDASYNPNLTDDENIGALMQKTRYDSYNPRGQVTAVSQWLKTSSGNAVFYKDSGSWARNSTSVSNYDPDTGWLLESLVYDGSYDKTKTDLQNLPALLQKTTYDVDSGTGNVLKTRRWNKDATGQWKEFAATSTGYDLQNRPIYSISPLQNVTATFYNGDGQLNHTSSNSSGSTINTTPPVYDDLGQVTTSTDNFGGQTHTLYDAGGNVVQTAYPDHTLTRSVHDSAGRVIWSVDRYDPSDSTTPRSGTLTHYDPATGRVLYTARFANVMIGLSTDPGGGTYSTTVTTPAAAPLSISQQLVDGFGRAIESDTLTGTMDFTSPLGSDTISNPVLFQKSTSAYNALGEQSSGTQWVRDNTGIWQPHTTLMAYDDLGRQVSTADADYVPTVAGQIDAAKAHTSAVTNDTLGRQIAAKSYNVDGHAITTLTAYDELGQKVAATDAVGNITRWSYDALGNLITVTLPAVHDARDTVGLASTISPIYRYTYDAEGHELTQVDPRLNETIFDYNGLGNTRSRTLPGHEGESFEYDRFSRRMTHTDFDGHVTAYLYDADPTHGGRLIEEQRFATEAGYASFLTAVAASPATKPPERTDTFYDGLGRRSSVDKYTGATLTRHESFAYDPITGALTQDAAPEATVNHAYDPATGRLIRTYTNFNDTRYRYDDLGRVAFVESYQLNGGTIATTLVAAATTAYAYDEAGNLKSTTLSNSNKTSYFYDGMNRLTDEKLTDGSNNPLAEFTYTLGDSGLRTSSVESRTGFSTTAIAWQYDADGRLVRETRDAGNNGLGGTVGAGDEADTYGIDLAGNRLYKDVFYDANAANAPDPTMTAARGSGNGKIDYTYNEDDQLLTETAVFTGGHSGESYATTYGHINGSNIFVKDYDANGSLLESHRTGNAAVDIANVYDLQNRLASATTTPSVGSTTTAIYAYDSDGNRIKETTNGTSTYFVNDLANPTGYSQTLEEKSAAGDAQAPTRSYVIGQQIIAQSDATNGKLDFEYDGHGSTRALIVDATGAVATGQIYAYDAYGNRITNGSSILPVTSILYTGQRFDASISQYFLRARNYDPVNGRFSSFDSQQNSNADPLSLHKYLYVNGDPVNEWDPSGFAPVWQEAENGIFDLYNSDPSHASNVVKTNKGIPSYARWLRPDVLDFTLGEAAEVKPLTPYGVATGSLQLAGYLRVLNGIPGVVKNRSGRLIPITTPPVPNLAGKAWTPSTWAMGVHIIPTPTNPDTLVFSIGNFGGVLYYMEVPFPRISLGFGFEAAKGLARSLQEVVDSFFTPNQRPDPALIPAFAHQAQQTVSYGFALNAVSASTIRTAGILGAGLGTAIGIALILATYSRGATA